jgi:predicted HicB family RNase H-like nuclease
MVRTGRPKKPPDQILSERVEIRLTADEKERFEAAAESAGVSLSEWLRKIGQRTCARRKG